MYRKQAFSIHDTVVMYRKVAFSICNKIICIAKAIFLYILRNNFQDFNV